MSVLIRGMEMPSCCEDCRMNNGISCYAMPEFSEDSVVGRTDDRPDWCPLVEVPPHGRLIDADALGIRDAEKQAYEAFLKEKGAFYAEEPLIEYMRGRLEGLADASGRVRFAPTIIPADPAEEEVYDKYTDTAGNLHWTGTHSGKHIIPAEEGE